MRVCDYNTDAIREALIRMPNLKNIDMSMGRGLYDSLSTKADRAFGDGYQPVFGDDGQKESCGVPQMWSLLLGANYAGLKLKGLRCGNVHWEIFKQRGEIYEEMREAVQYLTILKLHVITRDSDGGSADSLESGDHHSQISARAEYLSESGRLQEFVIAAPDLRVLDIRFDLDSSFDLDLSFDIGNLVGLKQIVGDFTWHLLQHLAFSVLQTTEDEAGGIL
ncbi:MAG: hypothetical protein ALECFALPRED_001800 [Alectoria fallacina]|uniref:Uncharacterized protein n=1 Tax=Alectoria fallacina TaxID=1903189 RepID=A0A8H3FIA5_9LECA|nr:MAG: hypothetical protein ALECFALPRED_001800 [Alectoria fallacina]